MYVTYELDIDKAFKKLNLEPGGLAIKTLVQTCMDLVEPYTPFKVGTLIKTAITAVDGDTGQLKWIQPYSRYLYYGKLMVSPTTGSAWAEKGEKKILTNIDLTYNEAPMRGAFWFDRMKNDRLEDILREVKRVIK